jgi:hypothetical protein
VSSQENFQDGSKKVKERQNERQNPCQSKLITFSNKPTIKIIGGQLPEMVEQAEEVLINYDSQIYQRSGFLVRIII